VRVYVDRLLEAGAPVNVTAVHPAVGHASRTTALCVAAVHGHCETVDLLLRRGARTDVYDELGRIVLSYFVDGAARQKQTSSNISRAYKDMLELLFSHGVNVNMSSGMGDTPLLKASAKGLDEVVELLLTHGANPFLSSSCGENPLMVACKNNHAKVAELLLAHGGRKLFTADVAVSSSPLHEAVKNGNDRLVAVTGFCWSCVVRLQKPQSVRSVYWRMNTE
jgi:ankyrin repeat protein